MAYSLESLVKIIDQIMHPHPHNRCRWILDPSKKPEIESLLNKARALKQLFGKSSSPLARDKMENLERRIRDAAYEAEDVLEFHLVGRIRSAGEGVSFCTLSPPSLQKVIGEFDSVEEEINKMMDGSYIPAHSSSPPTAAVSSRNIDPTPKKILVGLSHDSIELRDRLIRQEAELEVIPIVGMGGIGKTTLARCVYDDPFVVLHFDTRAWLTIPQEYSVRTILLGLLECLIGKLTDEMHQKQNDQLAVHLHNSLRGRRFIMVLDGIWDVEVWDYMKMFVPDDNSGSRVMLTTRELSVAHYARSSSFLHQMRLLNEDESWNLLRQKVFAQEACPLELEKIGQRIANNCGGLPLAIHVIGGLLSQAKRTQEYWAQVAEDVSSVVTNNDERFSKLLSLGYNYLPDHLKLCFLYTSIFPEDYEIESYELILLWMAEGFIEPVSNQSFEETAEMYLKSLVDRNLIFICRQETKRIVKTCVIHDLLRDLSMRIASEEKRLRLDRLYAPSVSSHWSHASMELMPLGHSSVFINTAVPETTLSPRVFFGSQSLRVLDLLGIQFHEFPEEMLRLINLRYLALACSSSSLPSSISALCNLQTIIFRLKSSNLRIEAIHGILDMPELRHIKIQDALVVYELQDGDSFVLQENLQTLSGITVCPGFNRLIKSLPNLKKLGVRCCFNFSSNIDLRCLRQLVTLKLQDAFFCQHFLFLIFPPSLRRLTLHNCRIPVGFMNKIGSLPNLEVLKLRCSTVESSTWEPTEGEFCTLQFLLLESLELVKWEADETHFPRLEHLIVRYCSKLDEIPSRIGEISTLETIEVHVSSRSVVVSARKILEEQLRLGNYGLRVHITGSSL